MAVLGTLIEPYAQDSVDNVAGLPNGYLITPYEADVPTGVSAVIAGRFPTPPSAFGFLTPVYEWELLLDGLSPPYVYTSALSPEATHLEPTIGQIWPRIG